jgi:tetratricopeptide (TPR) repeat protein
MEKGQYASAAIEFRNAIRLDPRSADSYYKLSQADMELHDWQGAYESLKKTIEIDPNHLNARLDRGRLYIATVHTEQAKQEAEDVLRKDPNNVGGYELLAAALIAQRKWDDALRAYSKLAELSPDKATPYLSMASINITLQRFKEAEEQLKKAIALDPKSEKGYVELANLYRVQKKLPEAQEALQAGIQNVPAAPQCYIDLADMLSDAGNGSGAEATLEKLRSRLPNSSEAAITIGEFYLRKNQSAKAIAEYRRGLSANSGNIDLQKRLEELYIMSGQTEQAAALDSQLMSHAPQDPLVNVLHGRLLLAQGKKQEAVIALQNAVKIAPHNAMAHTYLALAYWQNGAPSQAISELQLARKTLPNSPLLLRSLVQLTLSENRTSEAQRYAHELVQANPTNVNDRLLEGSISLRAGLLQQAREQFVVASRMAPNDASVHLHLAFANVREAKWADAEKEFDLAARLDPANPVIISAYADMLVSRGQAKRAIARAQQFVNENPGNARGHMVLGILQFDSQNRSAAQAEFERAIQLDPEYVQGYLQAGGKAQEKVSSDPAAAGGQKPVDPAKSEPIITLVGNFYLQNNDLETARKYYARALEVNPESQTANANMAWVNAQEAKDLDVALNMAQKAKSMAPGDARINDILAWVLFKRGNYSEAVPLLEECVKKDPDSAQFRYHLGLALIADGKKENGKAQLQAALRTDKLRPPEKEQAQQALTQAN